MTRRAVLAGLVVAAAFADGSGSASAGFYAFLFLVAAAAVIALNAYGEVVEAPTDPGEDTTTRRLQALLWPCGRRRSARTPSRTPGRPS